MKPTQLITKEEIQAAIPSRKGTITDEIVDLINKSQHEPEFQGESLLQTATTYESVLEKNKAGIKQYITAIRFCSYLIAMDDNFTEAYKKAFYETDFVKQRLTADTSSNEYKELTSASSRYRRSKLVCDILTMSQVPLHLMFTGMQYKALGVLNSVMTTAKLDRDKINAAKEILAATKGPENVQVALEVGMSEGARNMQQDLNSQLAKIAANQKTMLEGGMDIKEVQQLGLNAEFIEAEIDNGE